MDETIKAEVEQLTDDLLTATDEVGAALEAGEDQRQLAAGRAVEELARRYAALIAKMTPDDRDRVERNQGRRVTDLRRSAAQLTRRSSGQSVARAVDAGSVPFILQRTPSRPKYEPSTLPMPRERPRYSVGGEVEAWCGKCRALRDHHIVAMVGDEPKQVICQSCKSRHGFRTEPARKTGESGPPPTVAAKRAASAAERETDKRQEAKRALQKELADVAEPRPFDPKGRYKAGEIIIHPEHGRGKIENVLKSSLLVRFLEGLRPLDLT